MGRGARGKIGKIASRLGAAVVESTIFCHLAAALVCFSVAFSVADRWDRSLPFSFIMPYATPNVVPAGGWTSITFRFGEVFKLCPGDFKSFFIDSAGERFPLGTFPTIYQDLLAIDPAVRSYQKEKRIPAKAKDGPGIYESFPRYWCNLAHWFDPIYAPPLRITIIVKAEPEQLGTPPLVH